MRACISKWVCAISLTLFAAVTVLAAGEGMKYSRGPNLSNIASKTNNQSSHVMKLNLEVHGQTCVAYVNALLDTNEGENDDDHSLECSTQSEDTFDIQVEPSFVRENVIAGNLISGITLIELDGAHISKDDPGTLFFPEGIKLETNRSAPTPTASTPLDEDICLSSAKETCPLLGCVWKKEKCLQCSTLSGKSSKVCNKAGCNWAKEANECTSCNIADDKNSCDAISCVFVKLSTGKMCTPCALIKLGSKMICKSSGCAYTKKGCVSCITKTKEVKCKKNKGCDWKSGLCKKKITV